MTRSIELPSHGVDRRQLIAFAGLTGILSTFATTTALAQQLKAHDAEADLLAAALARARLTGKPVLAVVVPEGANERDRRASLLHLALTRASKELLATLALVEVVCVPMRALSRLDAGLKDQPLSVLIEQTRGTTCTAIADVCGDAPRSIDAHRLPKACEACVLPFSLALQLHIAGSHPRILELALRARVALDVATLVEVDRDFREPRVPPIGRADRAAAIYYRESTRDPHSPYSWLETLADVTRSRLLRLPPPGSRWKAIATGCLMGPDPETYSRGRCMLSFSTRTK